ncbi:MAG TPA: hypothetical protein PL009_12860 [Flavipsychrobacter sp.]|nr:hypothetical protein [Flavipsychrobacter sp.]
MKNNRINIILAVGLILMAATARIVNHELHLYNLAPVAAIGLFGGAVLRNKSLAFLMPLLALFIADLYIELFPSSATMRGFYGIEQWFVYASMFAVTLLGTKMNQPNATKVLGYSISGSAIFFIVSNFGAFVSGMYGHSFEGLTTTYVMAIPFLKNTLMSDLIGNTVLFGSYFLLQQALSQKLQKA